MATLNFHCLNLRWSSHFVAARTCDFYDTDFTPPYSNSPLPHAFAVVAVGCVYSTFCVWKSVGTDSYLCILSIYLYIFIAIIIITVIVFMFVFLVILTFIFDCLSLVSVH